MKKLHRGATENDEIRMTNVEGSTNSKLELNSRRQSFCLRLLPSAFRRKLRRHVVLIPPARRERRHQLDLAAAASTATKSSKMRLVTVS